LAKRHQKKVAPKQRFHETEPLASRIADAVRNTARPSKRDVILLLVLGLAMFCTGLIFNSSSVANIYSESSDEVKYSTEEFDGGKLTDPDAVTSGNPLKTEYGLATAPGSSWAVTWTFPIQPKATPFVRINSFVGPGVANKVVFKRGTDSSTVTLSRNYSGDFLIPENLISDAAVCSVSVVSTALPEMTRPVLVLDRLVVGSRVFPRGELGARFYHVFWLAVIPWLAWLLLAAFMIRSSRLWGILLMMCALALLLSYWAPLGFELYYYGICSCCFLLLCLIYYVDKEPLAILPWADSIVAIGMAMILLSMRWPFLLKMIGMPLPDDAADYMGIAKDMSHVLATKYREPGFIWLIRGWFAITEWSPSNLRLLTLLLSVAEAVAMWKLSRLFISPMLALLVLLAYAYNPALLASSVQGLREELFPLLVLVIVFLGVKITRGAKWSLTVGFAVTGGLLCLTRLSALPLVVSSALLVLFLSKAGWRRYAAVFGIVIGLITPMLVYQKIHNHELFYPSNSYVGTFYKNQEFKGKPGFPSVEEVQKNPWAGSRVGMAKYMFGLHPVGQAIRSICEGSVSVLFGKSAQQDLLRLNPNISVDYQGWISLPEPRLKLSERALFGLYVIGFLCLFFRRDRWPIVLAILAIQVPLGFLVAKGLIGWRLTMNAIPLMLICAGIGVHSLFQMRGFVKRHFVP